MAFGALPQDLLCTCTKENAFATLVVNYTVALKVQMSQKMTKENREAQGEIDALAEAFLDLWQENVRLCSSEDNFQTLQELIDHWQASIEQNEDNICE